MSNPHVPLDPDPLNPNDLDQAYAAGFEDGWSSVRTRAPRERLPVLAAIAATLALVVVAFAAGRVSAAAPRPAPNVILTDSPAGSSETRSGQIGAPLAVSGSALPSQAGDPIIGRESPRQRPALVSDVSSSEAPEAASGAETAGGAPSSPAGLARTPSATTSGTASWYRDRSRPADGLYAAVPGWRWGDRPYRVRVTAGGRSVVVWVSDACGCPGQRVIDLSPAAFRALAPLSVGLVQVTVIRA